MVYITGDCHGDFRRFSTKNFPEQNEMCYLDTVIVLGDFGLWHDTSEERYWLDWLNDKPFTTVFVDGNHENFDRLYSDEFKEYDFHGGKAHQICHNVFHLMRGYIFEFEGKKFFAFGGAKSHDIWGGILDPAGKTTDQFLEEYDAMIKSGECFRVKGVSWWPQELPTEKEMQRGIQELEKVNWKVDYVITHCLPTDIQSIFSSGEFETDILTDYLMDIARKLNFQQWYCGHYHCERTIMSDYRILYHQIIEVPT